MLCIDTFVCLTMSVLSIDRVPQYVIVPLKVSAAKAVICCDNVVAHTLVFSQLQVILLLVFFVESLTCV